MTNLLLLIPAALLLGGLGLAAFLWCLRSNQFDDLEGAAQRVLLDDPEDETARPMAPAPDRPGGAGSRRKT